MREAVRGTVWQPDVVRCFPGLLSSGEVAAEIFDIFKTESIELTDQAGLARALPVRALQDLQVYWVDSRLRGRNDSVQGIEWRQQREPGIFSAALGSQRAGPLGKHALPNLVQAGLGKSGHIQCSAQVTFPFQRPVPIDDDVDFAARATAALGPAIRSWRRAQTRALAKLAESLVPWERQARACMPAGVASVAGSKSPVLMTAEAVLLRWPDRTVGARYITGYRVVGLIEPSNLFRPVVPDPEVPTGEDVLLATAKENFHEMQQRVGPGPFDAELLDMCQEEVDCGFAEGFFTAEQLHQRFGRYGWRPLERFMHPQGCGKLRCIDSGKKPKHNEASLEAETIFTTSVDFIPAAVHAVLWYVLGTVQRLRYDDIDTLDDLSLEQLLGLLPAWLVFELGTEDMKNAYRQNPVHPDHYRFVTVAFGTTWTRLSCSWFCWAAPSG